MHKRGFTIKITQKGGGGPPSTIVPALKVLNNLHCSLSDIPIPLSLTDISRFSLEQLIVTSILPPILVNLFALKK